MPRVRVASYTKIKQSLKEGANLAMAKIVCLKNTECPRLRWCVVTPAYPAGRSLHREKYISRIDTVRAECHHLLSLKDGLTSGKIFRNVKSRKKTKETKSGKMPQWQVTGPRSGDQAFPG